MKKPTLWFQNGIPLWATATEQLPTGPPARFCGPKVWHGMPSITQRTANVTKTILNQCNSVFAMRTFDDTGKEFVRTTWVNRTRMSFRTCRSGTRSSLAAHLSAKILSSCARTTERLLFRRFVRRTHPPFLVTMSRPLRSLKPFRVYAVLARETATRIWVRSPSRSHQRTSSIGQDCQSATSESSNQWVIESAIFRDIRRYRHPIHSTSVCSPRTSFVSADPTTESATPPRSGRRASIRIRIRSTR